MQEADHRQPDDVEVLPLDPRPPGPRRAPGSRSRRRGSRHSPEATYRARSASSSERKVTSVRATAVRCTPSLVDAEAAAPPRAWHPRAAPARRGPGPRRRGLGRILPSTATTVSAPSTRPPRAAPALRRAFSCATSAGSPASSSGTSAGATVKATPSCSRIARRCGEREARTSLPPPDGAASTRPARGRTARPHVRRTRRNPSRAPCSARSPARSRRGSSRWPTPADSVAPMI